jgi:hypothetical protein
MNLWDRIDYSPYDESNTDEAKINAGIAVPCRLCENAFRRLTVTMRYCKLCHKGFCEGVHGNFSVREFGRCVQCGPHV